jgi:hypothetical protein
MAITANQLSSVAPVLLPPQITGPIFKKASESSAVQQLARRVPLAVNAQTAIPIPMDVPVADWVVEGGTKAVGNGGMGSKIMTGKKLALILPVSQELAMTNSAGLYDLLEQDLPTALSRSFDYAAIHGLSLKTGGAGPFTDYLAATPNAQVIGATAGNAGGVFVDLVKGVQQVVNASNGGYEVTGFAADPRLKPELLLSVDTNGRPLMVDGAYQNANASSGLSSLIGYPAAYNAGVSGRYYRAGNTVQVITQAATGGTMDITIAGQTVSAAAFNISTANLQTAIRALTFPGASTATVTGTAGTTYTVTLGGPGAALTINGKALTGGAATVADSPNLDSGLRAIGGDWSQCAYGVGMDITMKISTEASYTDGTTVHSAFQENLVLLLIEAYYGFVVGDVNAFVAYTHAVGS